MDFYKRHWNKAASPYSLVKMGRWTTIIMIIIVCFIAPKLGNPKFQGIFNYIQEFHGYITPGILAAFVFGMIFKRAPAAAGITALLLSVPIYGFLQWQFDSMAFFKPDGHQLYFDYIGHECDHYSQTFSGTKNHFEKRRYRFIPFSAHWVARWINYCHNHWSLYYFLVVNRRLIPRLKI